MGSTDVMSAAASLCRASTVDPVGPDLSGRLCGCCGKSVQTSLGWPRLRNRSGLLPRCPATGT